MVESVESRFSFVACIRMAETVPGTGDTVCTPYVYCPYRRRSVAFDETCRGCPRLLEEREHRITCAIEDAESERSLDTPVGRVADGNVVCAAPGVPIGVLREVLAKSRTSLAVVVERGRYLGAVDVTRLARRARTLEEEFAAVALEHDFVGRVASDLPRVPESSSIAIVAREMTRRGARRLPLVDVDGNTVGVIDDLALLRAVAPRRA